MSLDVTLKIKNDHECNCEFCDNDKYDIVHDSNITHNLGEMADKVGIYEALWRPHRLKDGYNIPKGDHESEYIFEENNPSKASEIISLLEKGLSDLKSRPEYFRKFNAGNSWGLYEHFVPFVEKYLKACIKYPDAIISVSR